MDTVEATKMVMSRIKKLDPEHASKIMGYILIQDQGDNEMIRLAFGPETLLLSVIKEAKSFLDIIPNNNNNNNNNNISSPWPLFDESVVPSPGGGLHRRSCSVVNDVYLCNGNGGDDVSGYGGGGGDDVSGWRPCMYYDKGFGFVDELGFSNGSSSVEDIIRFKAIQQQQQQQQRFGVGVGVHPFQLNRCMSFVNENPRSAAAALMLGDEFHKFGRCRPDRGDFVAMGFGNSNSSARQIYLTFPADSTFKEEDVSNYFSMFGPVQDVRIPYQQKRMFGFVTFMLPETVKAILAKGNPHFVCDSRVLVKPYKEKGKIPDRKHLQQVERGDFSGCLSPTALESAEPFDHIPFGARMFNHEMMMRRKLEEQELQQAIEFQDRRLMNLQLTDMKNHPFQRSLSISSPTQINQNLVFSSDCNNEELVSGGNNQSKTCDVENVSTQDNVNSPCDESDSNVETTKNESFELALPDNLFASPTKATATDNQNIFSNDMSENNYGSAIPIRITSKCQEAIEM